MLEPSLMVKEIRNLKKDLMLNEIKAMVPSGKIPPTYTSHLCKGIKRKLRQPRSHQQQESETNAMPGEARFQSWQAEELGSFVVLDLESRKIRKGVVESFTEVKEIGQGQWVWQVQRGPCVKL